MRNLRVALVGLALAATLATADYFSSGGVSNSVSGGLSLTSGALLLPDGTAGAPSVGWTSDADGTGTGLYRPSVNRIGFAINGTIVSQYISSGLHLNADAGLLFWGVSSDLLLGRDAAATLQMGVDSNTPTTQTIEALDAVSGVSNGSNLVLRGGLKATTGQDGVVIVGRTYTVATLPTGTPVAGARAWVSDAVACTFAVTPTGGGAVVCPVFYTGAAWVAG